MKGEETKHVVTFRKNHLKPTEQVEIFLEGWIGEMMGKGEKAQHNGMFIVTNERACFYRKGFLGEVLETIPLSKITSVETKSLMGYRVLRLHTSHDDLAFKTFELKPLFDEVYGRIEQLRHSPTSGRPPASEGDPIDQIRKLGELHKAGHLTDEEFETKKATLLRRL